MKVAFNLLYGQQFLLQIGMLYVLQVLLLKFTFHFITFGLHFLGIHLEKLMSLVQLWQERLLII